MHDIVVIGAGPAGLTASIYAARAGKSVLVLEKGTFGGQVTYSPKIENAPGFVSISGGDLADKLVEQALSHGADIEMETVLSVQKHDGGFTVTTDVGSHECRAVIIAAGVRHRMLGLEGEKELVGKGISFCVVCDGAFYADKTVAIIGGGNSAMQEAIMLSDLCKQVYVVQKKGTLSGERSLQKEIEGHDNITVLYNTVTKGLHGEEKLESIDLENTLTGEKTNLEVDGMFIAIGLEPQNGIFESLTRLENGYIAADEGCLTDTAGVFVAGDCRTKIVRQIATAAADGATAALGACAYIDGKL